ncbi:Uma2 family endonuclease [Cyanobacterium aponinum FACHB-4101]|uniref:Uma2 family endonuclease n=1 Tax=Cyanobacterium aponinum TaxID=379064 RepID=UPI001680AEA9|nr:Uma2 family endonuclease [Cyanobacterium aponinum]MBD2395112.1 Uma2 family endonuclease [Cyanobacterium aponinum FACHB-4101]
MLTLPRKKFAIEEYHQIIASGVLKEDYLIELINGEIFEMSPVGFRHASCVNKLNQLLSLKLGNKAIISIQNPIKLNDNSEPQPDIVLLKPRHDFYANQHPTVEDIFLLIEVADSSIEYDRTFKIPIYAENKVQEVWLVDLNQNLLEVYQNPQTNYYQNIKKLSSQDSITLTQPETITVKLDRILF